MTAFIHEVIEIPRLVAGDEPGPHWVRLPGEYRDVVTLVVTFTFETLEWERAPDSPAHFAPPNRELSWSLVDSISGDGWFGLFDTDGTVTHSLEAGRYSTGRFVAPFGNLAAVTLRPDGSNHFPRAVVTNARLEILGRRLS
jgi:hypothetical protein